MNINDLITSRNMCMPTATSGPKEKIDKGAFTELLHQRIDEAYETVKNGNPGKSFHIGGQEFTQDEWEKLIADIDEQEEQLRQQVEEEIEKAKVEKLKEENEEPQIS